MTQKEYMDKILDGYRYRIELNKKDFDAYCYNNDTCRTHLRYFRKYVEGLGLKYSNCYNANGIGNNNEYTIYLETADKDGFLVKKEIAEFYYCFGIFGGCFVRLTDLATGDQWEISRAH